MRKPWYVCTRPEPDPHRLTPYRLTIGRRAGSAASGPGRRRLLQGMLAALAPGPAARAAVETPGTEVRPEQFDRGPVPATLTLPLARKGPTVAAVVLVHDGLGPDARAEPYARQLLGAGIAVLEVLCASLDAATLAATIAALAADPRVDPARVGLLGFGRGAAGAIDGDVPVAARALLYPGCRGLAEAVRRPPAGGWRGHPVLVLHGGADRANPPALCVAAAAALAEAGAAVRRVEYRGASYAWDYPSHGIERRLLLEPPEPSGNLPPGRPGGVAGRVEAWPWPELAALSATQVASFFARALAP